MAITELVAVVPPPEYPDESGSLDDLAGHEREMGLTLPADFREYAVRYGSGWFLDTFLGFKNPFVTNFAVATVADGFCQRVFERGVVPWPQFPSRPGLFDIGGNENGDRLLFLADGDPDHWPIVVVPHGATSNQFERWDLPFGTFLARAMLNDIRTVAAHTPNQLVQPHERRFTRYSDKWDFQGNKWVRKRKARGST